MVSFILCKLSGFSVENKVRELLIKENVGLVKMKVIPTMINMMTVAILISWVKCLTTTLLFSVEFTNTFLYNRTHRLI